MEVDKLRLSKTSRLILEEFSRTQDWERVKKNLRVTDAEIDTAKKTAVKKIMQLCSGK